MTQSLQIMTPREMVRGLMRGDRDSFKQGYTAENAVTAVAEFHGLEATAHGPLLGYARGFHGGIRRGDYPAPHESTAHHEGYKDGLCEYGCYPG